MCVLANAIIAKTAAPNTKIIVYKNLTASFDPKLHQQTMNILKNLHVEIK
jgi:ABC-type oligopeptide transport system ATPase subunit